MGYPTGQWIELGIYMVGVTVLFIFTGLFSTYLTNKYFNKNKLYKVKRKSEKKKQWFYDVA